MARFIKYIRRSLAGPLLFVALGFIGFPIAIYLTFQQADHESLVTVLQSGDPLFGSTVSTLAFGRFSLNDHRQVVFRYTLSNGRTGIAIATRKGDD